MRKFLVLIVAAISLLLIGLSYAPHAVTLAQSPAAQADAPEDMCDAQGNCETEIGMITIEPSGVVNTVLNYSLVLGGSLALLLIIYGGFKLVTSAGNAREISNGKEIIQYAIIGLLLIVFSVTLVRVVQGGILQWSF